MAVDQKDIERKKVERFDIDVLRRHSREKDYKTFVVLNGLKIGFEINWENETMAWFLYRDKKRQAYSMSEHMSWYAGTIALKHALFALVFDYYQSINKDRIPLYAEIELSVPAQHFNYHAWAGTLEKALKREEV